MHPAHFHKKGKSVLQDRFSLTSRNFALILPPPVKLIAEMSQFVLIRHKII